MKNYLILLLSFFTLFCYGQKKDKFIDDRKQTIMNFLYSKQEVGVKNSFTNYVQFNIKKYKKLKKKYGDTLTQDFMVDIIQNDYLKSIKKKLNKENYSIIKDPTEAEIKDYNLILPKSKTFYKIYYLVDETGSIELSFIFEKNGNKIKYFLNDLFPHVSNQKVPVTYLEYFKILKPGSE